MIYCVIGRNEVVRLKSIVHEVDPHAFVSIIEVRDVAGEGFTLDDENNRSNNINNLPALLELFTFR